MESFAIALLQTEMPFPKSVRLLGVSLSSLQTHRNDEAVPQLDLPIGRSTWMRRALRREIAQFHAWLCCARPIRLQDRG